MTPKPTSQASNAVSRQKKINRAKGKPVYQQIQDFILSNIHNGTWQPGQPIESAPKLSKQLGVSYSTVCRAIDALVSKGLLTTRFGAGTYVAESALEYSVLWINGLALNGGDISPYFLNSFDIGTNILNENNIEIDSIWIGLGENPLKRPKIARGEVLTRYNGIILHACHIKHPVRKVLEKYDIQFLDLFHGNDNPVIAPVMEISKNLIDQWNQQGKRSTVIMRQHHQFMTLDHPEKIITGDRGGQSQNERDGFHAAMKRLAAGTAPDCWLVLDDIVARGVTRAILLYHSQNRDTNKSFPNVTILSSDGQAYWHGIPTDYILIRTKPIFEMSILPFVDKIKGKEPRRIKPGKLARYVKSDDPELEYLNPIGSHG